MFEALPAGVWWTLAGLYGVLAVATGAALALHRARPGKTTIELVDRVKSWWLMVSVFAIAIVLSRSAGVVFLAFVSFLALKEYFSIVPTRRADRRVLFWAYLAIPLQFWWVATARYGFFVLSVPVYMFLALPTMMVIQGHTAGFLRAVGTLHWGLMTCVFALGHAAYLLVLPGDGASGAGLLLYLLILTEGNDVAQYVWGKSFGRIKAAPTISPNKTVEGFLGGLVTTAVLAVLLGPVLTPFDWQHALAAGLIIGFAGFIGDVTISALKRDLGIKDTGNLIPGHGGILDRVDSLTFTAPLFFHFSRYTYFAS